MPTFWDQLEAYWDLITALGAILVPLLSGSIIVWVLMTKKNSTSAVAWCFLVILLPVMGPLFFGLFGYQHVSRPLSRKRKQRQRFRITHAAAGEREQLPTPDQELPEHWKVMERLAVRFGAEPMTIANEVSLYHEGH